MKPAFIKISGENLVGLNHLAKQWDMSVTEVVNEILQEALAIKEDM